MFSTKPTFAEQAVSGYLYLEEAGSKQASQDRKRYCCLVNVFNIFRDFQNFFSCSLRCACRASINAW